MNEAPRYVTVRDYLRVARERRWLIVVVAVLFTAAAYVYSSRQHEVYEAEATIEFQSQSTQTSLFGQNIDAGGQTPEARAAAAASTLVRPAILERAKQILHFAGPANLIGPVVGARAEARTNLVIVRASTRTAQAAADTANAVARAAVAVARDDARREFTQAAAAQRNILRRLRNDPTAGFGRVLTQQSIARLEELANVVTPAVLRREATVPGSPSGPHTVRTTLLGLLVGLTLGLVAAFFRDSLDGRMRSTGEITSQLDLRVLGHLPEGMLGSGLAPGRRRWWRRRRGPLTDADLEQVRILRTNLEFLDEAGPPKLVLVTSAMPDEGKSTVATALAAAYATAGRRTLMVEGDLRRPSLAARLGVAASPGLSDYLVGRGEPHAVLQTVGLPGGDRVRAVDAPEPAPIVAIVAGSPAQQPAELLSSQRCQAFFEQVKEAYDVVIVDACPILPVVDALELVGVADAVILCVRASQTTRGQVEAAKEILSHLPERPLGVVVTGARVGDEQASYGYYTYGATGATAR